MSQFYISIRFRKNSGDLKIFAESLGLIPRVAWIANHDKDLIISESKRYSYCACPVSSESHDDLNLVILEVMNRLIDNKDLINKFQRTGGSASLFITLNEKCFNGSRIELATIDILNNLGFSLEFDRLSYS